MSKSSDYDFIGLYSAMLQDVAEYLPTDRVEWDRDLSRVTLLSESRGTSVFTMDLPALGKALDASLARRRLCLDDLNHSGSRHPGSKIPRLFWGLWSRLFDSDGCLKQDIDPNIVVFLRGLLYVGKNLNMECAPRYLFETVKEFYDVEATVPSPSHIWEGDGTDLSRSDCGSLLDYHIGGEDLYGLSSDRGQYREASMLNCVQQFADAVSGDIGLIEPERLQFRHGPGAVSDSHKGKYKFDFPAWSNRLETIFPYTAFGSTPLAWDGVDPRTGVNVDFKEIASNLIAVPKTQKGPRLIAAEPTCHQWIQQGLRDHLYAYVERRSALLNASVTFRDQRPSGELALVASKSGQYATVDLKSASDRLSTQLVQRIFRANISLLGPMIASRTRFIVNRIDLKSPSLHKLRKFSTQGSALTFPIQSLVFAIICVGVGKYLHPNKSWRALSRRVRVFGDDIIVPVLWEPHLRQILHLLGLRVNETKTYSEGNFRESCGVDGWCGYDVTPPHVSFAVEKSNARSVVSNVAVSNNFYKKGWWHAASLLHRQLASSYLLVVGPYSGLFGMTSYSGAKIPTRLSWNQELHYSETRALQVFAKSRKVTSNTAGTMLEYFSKDNQFLGTAWDDGPMTGHIDSQAAPSGFISDREVWFIDQKRSLRHLSPREFTSGVVHAADPVIRVRKVAVHALG